MMENNMIEYPRMLIFWEQVRKLLTDDLNQAWLCRKIGVSSSTLSAWINRNRLPKADLAVQIAQALGVSVEYLVTGGETNEEDEDDDAGLSLSSPSEIQDPFITPSQKEYVLSDTQSVIFVPILDQRVSAGHGEPLIEQYEPEKVLPVLNELVNGFDKSKLRVVTVKGDSMTGIQLFGGDLVVFAKDHVDGDGVYVISIGDEALVKRLEFDPFENKVLIHSENKNYQPKAVSADSDLLRIEGKVIGWYHKHPY
jgi:phage repressor protein C with HTH and peptisase S24 domain